MQPAVCHQCGQALPVDAKFCSRCGASVVKPSARVPIRSSNQVGGCVMGLIVFGLIYWGLSSGFSCTALSRLGTSPQQLRDRLRIGMTYAEVRSAIGEPEQVQKMEGATDVGGGQVIKTDMQFWYYKGVGLQVAFDDGRVTSINQY